MGHMIGVIYGINKLYMYTLYFMCFMIIHGEVAYIYYILNNVINVTAGGFPKSDGSWISVAGVPKSTSLIDDNGRSIPCVLALEVVVGICCRSIPVCAAT